MTSGSRSSRGGQSACGHDFPSHYSQQDHATQPCPGFPAASFPWAARDELHADADEAGPGVRKKSLLERHRSLFSQNNLTGLRR
jgi:hypothetical protein